MPTSIGNILIPPSVTRKSKPRRIKARKGFMVLCCFKVGGVKKKMDTASMSGKSSMVDGPSKWQFPRTPTSEYTSPNPYYRPFEAYPPPMMGRPSAAPPYHPFGLMCPPPPPLQVPPPPHGFFNSRTPPKVNPMIHYTSYADNYSRCQGTVPGIDHRILQLTPSSTVCPCHWTASAEAF
ncbi:hypothetical protein DITRI_Ditri07aG0045600 [Diplodiscus trichospermus]